MQKLRNVGIQTSQWQYYERAVETVAKAYAKYCSI